jgi:hypothetical protein
MSVAVVITVLVAIAVGCLLRAFDYGPDEFYGNALATCGVVLAALLCVVIVYGAFH